MAGPMFATLPIVRQLHELMWYLAEALKLGEARPVHPRLHVALAETDRLAGSTPEELRVLDLEGYRRKVNPLLLRASDLARRGVGGRRADHRGANLIRRRMRGADLTGALFSQNRR